ncbi:MAG TPA: gliding motility lipoprotein GldD [Parapedobacter sp.]|uniref:gliding motility lipoprotein GldD n=1 Tax=Parapedobacter sp. TaxID=1958893 RepID=UPI002BA04B14|nr:gliding motility lipoprotein GldD [Parapedobacter sp.]HWK58937.1 gliding motility lipoprotein GldD [Parapedobacter sp.]
MERRQVRALTSQWVAFGLLVALCVGGCQHQYSPKPRGYFRIEFPEKEYRPFTAGCPYTFDIPVYAKMEPDRSADAQPCWMDIHFPQFNARIHLSYMPVSSPTNFNELVEDARTFAFNHTVKATAIDQQRIRRPEAGVYGLKYEISGNTASNIQFFVTDSTRHYLRGALYFHEKPRLDSIQPVLDFIKADIDTLIGSLRWE